MFASNSRISGPVPTWAGSATMGSLAKAAAATTSFSASGQIPCFDDGPPVSHDCTCPCPKPGFTRTATGPR